ncbi:general odorant-binding protein 72-like [Periplaneta americana]|uniref:general odorant-binding protein 72-like n=1 Tax=Periplaneta americana TaxID=6978 RepID=UPI0037E94C4F
MNRLASLSVVMVILAAVLRETSGVIIMAQQDLTAKLIRSKCQPESGASTEAIEGVREGKFPDDRNLKCYMSCAMTMSLTMRDGKLAVDLTKSIIERMMQGDTKARALAAVDKCSNSDAGLSDACDIAFAATKCIHDADPDILTFP